MREQGTIATKEISDTSAAVGSRRYEVEWGDPITGVVYVYTDDAGTSVASGDSSVDASSDGFEIDAGVLVRLVGDFTHVDAYNSGGGTARVYVMGRG